MGEIIRFRVRAGIARRALRSVELSCTGHAGGGNAERFIGGAARSLRRVGIRAWVRRMRELDPRYTEDRFGLLVLPEDEARGLASFATYLERVNRRAGDST